MIASINIDVSCKRCGGVVTIDQTELGEIKVGICKKCVRSKLLTVLNLKKAEFDATYDEIRDIILNQESGGGDPA